MHLLNPQIGPQISAKGISIGNAKQNAGMPQNMHAPYSLKSPLNPQGSHLIQPNTIVFGNHHDVAQQPSHHSLQAVLQTSLLQAVLQASLQVLVLLYVSLRVLIAQI